MKTLAVAMLAILALPGLGSYSEDELRRQVDALNEAIAEQLPPGSTIEQVEAFLVDKGIQEYTTSPYNGGGLLMRQRPDLVERVKYRTAAAIRDVYKGLLVRKSIYPRFYFDDDRKLLWSTVEVIADGL